MNRELCEKLKAAVLANDVEQVIFLLYDELYPEEMVETKINIDQQTFARINNHPNARIINDPIDDEGRTLFAYAAFQGKPDIISLLTILSADVFQKDKQGHSSYYWAMHTIQEDEEMAIQTQVLVIQWINQIVEVAKGKFIEKEKVPLAELKEPLEMMELGLLELVPALQDKKKYLKKEYLIQYANSENGKYTIDSIIDDVELLRRQDLYYYFKEVLFTPPPKPKQIEASISKEIYGNNPCIQEYKFPNETAFRKQFKMLLGKLDEWEKENKAELPDECPKAIFATYRVDPYFEQEDQTAAYYQDIKRILEKILLILKDKNISEKQKQILYSVVANCFSGCYAGLAYDLTGIARILDQSDSFVGYLLQLRLKIINDFIGSKKAEDYYSHLAHALEAFATAKHLGFNFEYFDRHSAANVSNEVLNQFEAYFSDCYSEPNIVELLVSRTINYIESLIKDSRMTDEYLDAVYKAEQDCFYLKRSLQHLLWVKENYQSASDVLNAIYEIQGVNPAEFSQKISAKLAEFGLTEECINALKNGAFPDDVNAKQLLEKFKLGEEWFVDTKEGYSTCRAQDFLPVRYAINSIRKTVQHFLNFNLEADVTLDFDFFNLKTAKFERELVKLRLLKLFHTFDYPFKKEYWKKKTISDNAVVYLAENNNEVHLSNSWIVSENKSEPQYTLFEPHVYDLIQNESWSLVEEYLNLVQNKKVRFTFKEEKTENTLLHCLVRAKQYSLIKKSTHQTWDLLAKNKKNETALSLAFVKNNTEESKEDREFISWLLSDFLKDISSGRLTEILVFILGNNLFTYLPDAFFTLSSLQFSHFTIQDKYQNNVLHHLIMDNRFDVIDKLSPSLLNQALVQQNSASITPFEMAIRLLKNGHDMLFLHFLNPKVSTHFSIKTLFNMLLSLINEGLWQSVEDVLLMIDQSIGKGLATTDECQLGNMVLNLLRQANRFDLIAKIPPEALDLVSDACFGLELIDVILEDEKQEKKLWNIFNTEVFLKRWAKGPFGLRDANILFVKHFCSERYDMATSLLFEMNIPLLDNKNPQGTTRFFMDIMKLALLVKARNDDALFSKIIKTLQTALPSIAYFDFEYCDNSGDALLHYLVRFNLLHFVRTDSLPFLEIFSKNGLDESPIMMATPDSLNLFLNSMLKTAMESKEKIEEFVSNIIKLIKDKSWQHLLIVLSHPLLAKCFAESKENWIELNPDLADELVSLLVKTSLNNEIAVALREKLILMVLLVCTSKAPISLDKLVVLFILLNKEGYSVKSILKQLTLKPENEKYIIKQLKLYFSFQSLNTEDPTLIPLLKEEKENSQPVFDQVKMDSIVLMLEPGLFDPSLKNANNQLVMRALMKFEKNRINEAFLTDWYHGKYASHENISELLIFFIEEKHYEQAIILLTLIDLQELVNNESHSNVVRLFMSFLKMEMTLYGVEANDHWMGVYQYRILEMQNRIISEYKFDACDFKVKDAEGNSLVHLVASGNHTDLIEQKSIPAVEFFIDNKNGDSACALLFKKFMQKDNPIGFVDAIVAMLDRVLSAEELRIIEKEFRKINMIIYVKKLLLLSLSL